MTSAERKVLRAAQSRAALQRSAVKRDRRRIDAFMRMRRRAEREFKRGLGERMLEVAGIDRKTLERRLAKDRATIKNFLVRREAEAKRGSVIVRRRQLEQMRAHLARIKHAAKNTPYGGSAPVPRLDAVLNSAADIDIEGATESAKSIAPQQNIARADFNNDNDTSLFSFDPGSLLLGQITWWFTWTPHLQGWLNVSAFLLVNGHLFLWAIPGCGTDRSGTASIGAFVSITQLDPQGNPFTVTSAPRTLIERSVKKSFDESTGQVDVYEIDITDVVTPDQSFPLFGTGSVTIGVTLAINLFSQSTTGEINLFDQAFSANVPVVIVSLS